MMNVFSRLAGGILAAAALAAAAKFCSALIPYELISAGVFAMLIGMMLHPLAERFGFCREGIAFTSKKILKGSIVLMGITLSFSQVLEVGKFSLIVMCFTLTAAFGFGNLFGRMFGMNWKLSNLISAGTGICGGSAIAAISPTIDADDSDIAYAISATFLFDIVMVILFPIMGRAAGMSDMGFGLWAGTAVNDTSSVVAAGYAFSDLAGQFSTIVKLTRTLSIVPIVILFAYINERMKAKAAGTAGGRIQVSVRRIFPWFILLFLGMVAVRSLLDAMAAAGVWGMSAAGVGGFAAVLSSLSKFGMVMALGAIGLKTDFKNVAKSGFIPMLHGFIISALVVIVSFGAQAMLGQL